MDTLNNKVSHHSQETIDLRQYLAIINRYKWGILGLASAIAMLTTLVVFSMSPVYKASATLLIESSQANIVSIEEVYGLDPTNNEYYLTQFEILRSRQLAETVIDKLQLSDHPEFNPAANGSKFNWRDLIPFQLPEKSNTGIDQAQRHKQQITERFLAKLTISPVRKTQLVTISFEAGDALLAAQIANAVGEAYIDNNLEARLQLTYKASEWLLERLSGLREQLKTSEKRLQQYREQENIIGTDGGFNIANTELDLVASRLVDARRKRLETESLYRQIKSVDRQSNLAYEQIPAILQHPLIRELKKAELEVTLKKAELAKRYGPKHPKMRAVQSELSDVQSSLKIQFSSIVSGIENDYQLARTAERGLQASVDDSKQDLQSINRKEYRLKELEQEVDANRQLYETFFNRLNETNAAGNLKTANARIADPALPPLKPAKPRTKLTVAISFVLGLIIGLVLSFVLEALNNTLRSITDIEDKLYASTLGLLPFLKNNKREPPESYFSYVEEPKSDFAESVRTIRTGLVISSLNKPYKTIACTSSVPGEGKTTLALSLSFCLGQMEKVLLIDADMRRPSIAKAFSIPDNHSGLSELVAGTATLEESIQQMPEHGIDLLSAGSLPPNPLDLLGSQRFKELLKGLEGRYDRIIIDTAPTLAVSDALLLSQLISGMIYVVKADATSCPVARSGLKRLQEINAPVIGVVLNQIDTRKAARYSSDHYSGYYDSYGYSKPGCSN
ncbi:GumC family protein [Amphritea sp. HPY]|uniref:GumC family protein n=1 Tax=Amphritea sp. HPY TaxID=3421652 RepID=UPI003D7C542B